MGCNRLLWKASGSSCQCDRYIPANITKYDIHTLNLPEIGMILYIKHYTRKNAALNMSFYSSDFYNSLSLKLFQYHMALTISSSLYVIICYFGSYAGYGYRVGAAVLDKESDIHVRNTCNCFTVCQTWNRELRSCLAILIFLITDLAFSQITLGRVV